MKLMVPVEKIRKFTDLIGSINDEVILNISDQGLNVVAVDKSSVAMITATLKPDAFGLLPSEPVKFAIDVPKFDKALRLAKAGDIITLTPSESELTIDIGKDMVMTNRLLNIDMNRIPKMPEIAYSSAFTVNASELQRIVRASDGIAPALTLSISHKGCELFSKGDTSSVSLTLDAESVDFTEGEYFSTVGLEYINAITRVMAGSDSVYIELNQDYPVSFRLNTEDMDVKFLIAPRIDRD
jgi:proliferating cell nuclear antigen PCNA